MKHVLMKKYMLMEKHMLMKKPILHEEAHVARVNEEVHHS